MTDDALDNDRAQEGFAELTHALRLVLPELQDGQLTILKAEDDPKLNDQEEAALAELKESLKPHGALRRLRSARADFKPVRLHFQLEIKEQRGEHRVLYIQELKRLCAMDGDPLFGDLEKRLADPSLLSSKEALLSFKAQWLGSGSPFLELLASKGSAEELVKAACGLLNKETASRLSSLSEKLNSSLERLESKSYLLRWTVAGNLGEIACNALLLFIFPSLTAPLSCFIAAIVLLFLAKHGAKVLEDHEDAVLKKRFALEPAKLKTYARPELGVMEALLFLLPGLAVNLGLSFLGFSYIPL